MLPGWGGAKLKKFRFDLALSSSIYALPGLLVSTDHTIIGYGSD